MRTIFERSLPVALALLGACATTERRVPIVSDSPAVRTARPARAWEVRRGDEVVGRVVYFEERSDLRGAIYVVRNPWHQDLGMVDALGRAYRYLPHHLEPAWVGTGTVAQGVARILGLPVAECELDEVELPASAEAPSVPESP
jgi:hypothetical protein